MAKVKKLKKYQNSGPALRKPYLGDVEAEKGEPPLRRESSAQTLSRLAAKNAENLTKSMIDKMKAKAKLDAAKRPMKKGGKLKKALTGTEICETTGTESTRNPMTRRRVCGIGPVSERRAERMDRREQRKYEREERRADREYRRNKLGGKITKAKVGKKMLKRADGSVSQRGLWDNIRAAAKKNRAAGKPGKKPTAQMLKQERKIKAKSKK